MIQSITEQLFNASNGIIKEVPEVADNLGKYHMADDGGVETETGEFLYGLVRILQPEKILETGTYTGISAMYMGQALLHNQHGDMVTLEVEPIHKNRAEQLWAATGVSPVVTCKLQKSLEFNPEGVYDLIFLDSEPEFRFKELIKFYPYLKHGGYFFIHDLHRHLSQHENEKFFGWPFGELPEEIKGLIEEDALRVISFPTPRGLTGFYKPTNEDYRN